MGMNYDPTLYAFSDVNLVVARQSQLSAPFVTSQTHPCKICLCEFNLSNEKSCTDKRTSILPTTLKYPGTCGRSNSYCKLVLDAHCVLKKYS